jgi:surface antigen
MNAARERVVVVDLWTDANNWAAVADPRLYPSIGLGFRYGRTPEVFSVASPTAGLMFSNDTMPGI